MPHRWGPGTLGALGVTLFAGCSGTRTPPPAQTSPYEVARVALPSLDCTERELWQDPENGKIGMQLVEVSYLEGCACDGPGRGTAPLDVDETVRAYLKENVSCSPSACDKACVCSIVVAEDHVSCQNDPETTSVGWCYVDAARGLGNPALVQNCPDGGKRGVRFVGGAAPASDQELYSVLPYCTAVGCQDGVYWIGDVSLSPTRANHLTITLCRNDVCTFGKRTMKRIDEHEWQVSGGANGGGGLSGECVPSERDGIVSLDCELPVPVEQLAGGEHYTLTVVDDDTGQTLVSLDKRLAAYDSYFPNGPTCGPPCLSGSLK
jgi:hypothetical protein